MEPAYAALLTKSVNDLIDGLVAVESASRVTTAR